MTEQSVNDKPAAWIKPEVLATLKGDECCYAFGKQSPAGNLVPLYAVMPERKLLVDALGHIKRICENSRTGTRRLRWVIQRATWALAGKEYDRDQFSLPETGRSYQSMKQELKAIKARYAVCRDVGNYVFFEDMSNGDGLIPTGEEFDALIDAQIQKQALQAWEKDNVS